MQNKTFVTGALAALALVVLTAGATAYYVNNKSTTETSVVSKPVKAKTTSHVSRNKPAAQPQYQTAQAQPVQAKPACDDGNIVGTVIGGAAGGVAGHQIGKGSGNTAATIAGTLGGAYVGNQYIPTRGVTCR